MISIHGEEYYTAAEACHALDVKVATLYSYVNRGLLRSYRQGVKRHRLYRRSEVDALLRVSPASRENTGPEIPPAESWASEH